MDSSFALSEQLGLAQGALPGIDGARVGGVNNTMLAASPLDGETTIFPPMSKPSANSTLYRLIEAGQLAHKALLVPLVERGLLAGDDAVLFVLSAKRGATEEAIADELGLPRDAVVERLTRLTDRDLVARRAIGPELDPGFALTERGERIKALLVDNWAQLEEALLGELKKKKRLWLGEALARFVDLLRL